jgi:hypothetical protein
MKALLLATLLWCAALSATAQEWKSPLPVDSATHKITYQGIVQVPGVSQLALYARALNWLTHSFGPSIATLESSDISTGSLTANGYVVFDYAFMKKSMQWSMWRRVKIETKDGRYRYTITDFRLGGPIETPEAGGSSVDEWLAPFIAKSKPPTRLAQSIVNGVEQTAATQISSLQARMSTEAKEAKKEKDW